MVIDLAIAAVQPSWSVTTLAFRVASMLSVRISGHGFSVIGAYGLLSKAIHVFSWRQLLSSSIEMPCKPVSGTMSRCVYDFVTRQME